MERLLVHSLRIMQALYGPAHGARLLLAGSVRFSTRASIAKARMVSSVTEWAFYTRITTPIFGQDHIMDCGDGSRVLPNSIRLQLTAARSEVLRQTTMALY